MTFAGALPPRLSFALWLATTLPAQCPPGAPMPLDLAAETAVAPGPAQIRWQAGKEALANGAFAAAREHLAAALEFHPSAPDLLLDMLAACQDAPELAAWWSERYARRGRCARQAGGRQRGEEAPGRRARRRRAAARGRRRDRAARRCDHRAAALRREERRRRQAEPRTRARRALGQRAAARPR